MPAFFLARDDVNVLLRCHHLAHINGNVLVTVWPLQAFGAGPINDSQAQTL
jgi:hypothetical protein